VTGMSNEGHVNQKKEGKTGEGRMPKVRPLPVCAGPELSLSDGATGDRVIGQGWGRQIKEG